MLGVMADAERTPGEGSSVSWCMSEHHSIQLHFLQQGCWFETKLLWQQLSWCTDVTGKLQLTINSLQG